MNIRSAFQEKRSFVMALSLFASLGAGSIQAQLITGNNAAFNNGPIQTNNFGAGGTLVGSFVPDGAKVDSNNGRGVEVIGNKVFYTELSGGGGPTDKIRIAPFNGGAGGADTGSVPNPRPTTGVQDLAFVNSSGVLYAMTGYPLAVPQVFGLNPLTGAVLSGPVTISAPATPGSDGFTVLPTGNFLINNGDESCTYNQYNPATGAVISGTTLVVPLAAACTGVDTDGSSLYFQTDFNGYTKTDMTGALLAHVSVADLGPGVEDISLQKGFAGTPGAANCHGKSVSSLAQQYGGMDNAATALGYASVSDLQDAIRAFCGS